MKILTYNVRSWYRDLDRSKSTYWRKRADAIRELIAKTSPDVILLQEAIWPMTNRCIPEGYVKASGCSISHHVFIKEGFAEVLDHSWHMRWSRARLRLPNASRFEICSVHTHWDKAIRERTAEEIKELRAKGAAVIAGGDWNNTTTDMRPLLFPMTVLSTGRRTFKNWESGNREELDYFALSHPGLVTVNLVVGGSFTNSDHLPVVAQIP